MPFHILLLVARSQVNPTKNFSSEFLNPQLNVSKNVFFLFFLFFIKSFIFFIRFTL